jgi:hypothetical protein
MVLEILYTTGSVTDQNEPNQVIVQVFKVFFTVYFIISLLT